MFVEKLKQKDFDEFVDTVYFDDYEGDCRAVVSFLNGVYYLRVAEPGLRENAIYVVKDFSFKPFNYSAVVDSNTYKNINTTWRKFLAKKFGVTYTKAYEKFRKEEIKTLNDEIAGR